MSANSKGPRSAVHTPAIVAAVALALGTASVHAQQNTANKAVETALSFDIPAQPLASALNRFGDITGFQLVYAASLAENKRSVAVAGSLKARDALARMLAGTGLEFRFTDSRTVILQAAHAPGSTRVLGPVRVEGAQQPEHPARGEGVAQLGGIRGGQDQEARGYRPVVAAVGAGAPTAMEDIPRSVSVLTQEQIQQQDINDIGEALRHMAGVSLIETPQDVSRGAAIVSRGFRVSQLQVDGDTARPLNVIDNGMLDIGPYERIELVRGANGVFTGDASPGGSLNLVRKRPGMAESLEVSAVGGSWNRRQLGVDYSTPGIAGSQFAFRGVATYQDQEFFYGNSDRRNWMLYGVVDAPLGDAARVELGYTHSDIYERGSYNGIKRYAEGPLWDLPRDYNFTPMGVYEDMQSNEVFGKLFMDLPHNWNFEVGVSYADQDLASVDYILSVTFLQATKTPVLATTHSEFLREQRFDSKNLGANFRIAGRARTFGLDHNLYFTGEFNENSAPGVSERDSTTGKQILTFADLDPSTIPAATFPAFARSRFLGSSSTRALVVGDTISWRDWVDLSLSGRRQESNSDFFLIARDNNEKSPTYGQVKNTQYGAATLQKTERKPQWQPNWFLTLKPLKGFSVYGSVSGGVEPQDERFTPAGNTLGPLTYDNRELGVKYGAQNWLATAALYNQTRSNVAAAIPGSNGQCPPNPTSVCYFEQGDSMRSRGVELELTGEIVSGLGVSASYSYNHTKTLPGVKDDYQENFTQAPDRQAHLLLDWRLPFLRRTSVNVGATYRSSTYQAGTLRFIDPVTGKTLAPAIPYEFTEPSWVVMDVGFRQELTRNLALNVLVENVTNKEYLSTVGYTNNFVGRPRSVTATLRWKPHGDAPSNGISPSTGKAPFGDPGRWYGALELGRHDAGTLDARSDGPKRDGTRARWNFETEQDAASFARLGYRLAPHWRVEAEGGFRATSFGKISGPGSAPNGVCDPTGSSAGRQFNCENSLGEADAWSLMFNGLYDFGTDGARVRPFVGVGAGLARWSIDFGGKLKGVGLDTPWPLSGRRSYDEAIGSDDQSVTWAWQAMAGAAVRLTDRAQITASYSFFNAPKLKWDSYNMPTLTPTLGAFRTNYKEQAWSLGFRWFFGNP